MAIAVTSRVLRRWLDEGLAMIEDQKREDARRFRCTNVAGRAMGMARPRRLIPGIARVIGDRRQRINANLDRAFEDIPENRPRMEMRR